MNIKNVIDLAYSNGNNGSKASGKTSNLWRSKCSKLFENKIGKFKLFLHFSNNDKKVMYLLHLTGETQVGWVFIKELCYNGMIYCSLINTICNFSAKVGSLILKSLTEWYITMRL